MYEKEVKLCRRRKDAHLKNYVRKSHYIQIYFPKICVNNEVSHALRYTHSCVYTHTYLYISVHIYLYVYMYAELCVQHTAVVLGKKDTIFEDQKVCPVNYY